MWKLLFGTANAVDSRRYVRTAYVRAAVDLHNLELLRLVDLGLIVANDQGTNVTVSSLTDCDAEQIHDVRLAEWSTGIQVTDDESKGKPKEEQLQPHPAPRRYRFTIAWDNLSRRLSNYASRISIAVGTQISALTKNNKRPYKPRDQGLIPNAFGVGENGDEREAYTLIELRLLAAFAAIRLKARWWEKIIDRTIRGRWHQELVAGFTAFLLEPVQWKYEGAEDDAGREAVASKWAAAVISELTTDAAQRVVHVGDIVYSPGPVEGTWMSDSAISPELKARLAALVAPLESPVDPITDLPAVVDYHPGSNKQVIDLVHPSMYPYVYGFSREVALPAGCDQTIFSWHTVIGSGQPNDERTPVNSDFSFTSTKFQWLPSEVDVVRGESGEYTAHFRSYINNLHPAQHTELYRALEEVLAKFIPMFERVIWDLLNPKLRRHEVCMWEEGPLHGSNPFDCETQEEAHCEWADFHICTVRTDLGLLDYPNYLRRVAPEVPRAFEIGTQRLQVIVKIATIELSPEKPTYDGGAWHVEGMENEEIVASGIYYWLSENVAGDGPEGSTRLAFRGTVCPPYYDQNDACGVRAVYGLEDDRPLIQPLGSIPTIEGRAMAWPNTHQHQVQPFRLADPSKPGFRKILVYFLVDPTKRIVSTADVPPQQEEWYAAEQQAKQGTVASPDWPYTHEKALEVRKELMAERKYFTDHTLKNDYERPFSMCEH